MEIENQDGKNEVEDTTATGTSPDENKSVEENKLVDPEAVNDSEVGKTPDELTLIKEKLENREKAMKEERYKRQQLEKEFKELRDSIQKSNSPVEEDDDFDPEVVAQFEKLAKKQGYVKQQDLQYQKQVETTVGTYQNFINKNLSVFGSDADHTDEQDENWRKFSSHLSEYFDVTDDKIKKGNIQNLDKKLNKAFTDLFVQQANQYQQGKNEALIEQQERQKTQIGGGSSGSAPQGGWRYKNLSKEEAKAFFGEDFAG